MGMFQSWAKALRSMIHAGGRWFLGWWGSSVEHDYHRKVGTGLNASVVMAPVQWLQRAVPEGTLAVERLRGEGKRLPDHPLVELLARPNPGYSFTQLLQATIWSLIVPGGGNAYWIKVRNGAGKVVEAWYAPHWLIEPRWPAHDHSVFISHYDYKAGGQTTKLEPEDVVHFRVGIDPTNTRLGLSPLNAAVRDIWSDMEASVFIASLLRNSGIPGLVLSPDGPAPADKEDVKEIKRYLQDSFTGEKRGEPLVFSSKTKVDRVSFNARELDLSGASDRAEERVCALLGIPASVVGFGSGMEQTKVGATMNEQVKLAWSNAVIPFQTIVAEEIQRSLLPDLERRPETVRVYFDNSEVKALAEDEDKLAARSERLVNAGMITVREGREMLGMEADETHNIYLRSFGVVEVPGDTGRAPTTPAPDDATPGTPLLEGATVTGAGGEAPKRKQHAHHTAFEERIARNAPHGEPTPEQLRFVRALEEEGLRLAGRFAAELAKFFNGLAERARAAARPVVDELLKGEPGPAGRETGGRKDTALNTMVTDRVIEAMNLPQAQRLFREHYERHFLDTAKRVAERSDMVGLATNLPDRVGRAVIATGGRRAGLVDLTRQAREAVLRTVAEQRAEGAGVDAIVSAIAEAIPAGPWSSSRVRARVIARTETKFAQNVSVFEHSRANNVTQFMVFDARLGETDEICEMMDGAIVSAEEAQQLMSDEHPNGTRSFTPYFG